MTEERKLQLMGIKAAELAAQMYPDEFKDVQSTDDLQNLIKNHESEITSKLGEVSEEEFNLLDQQYAQQEADENKEQAMYAAKGAKLKKLKDMKNPTKKCKCGCDLISVKEKGGKITTKCACNCGGGKVSKNQNGGILNFLKKGGVAVKQTGGDINKPTGSVEKKGGKVDRLKKAQLGSTIQPIKKQQQLQPKLNAKKPMVKKEACGGKVKDRIHKK